MNEFSLFEGDLLNRLFLRIGIRSRGAGHLALRVVCLLVVTFVPTAFICWRLGYGPGGLRTMNFFGDIGALGQAFLGYPLFVIAEWLIGEKTRATGNHFLRSGVVLPEGIPTLERCHEQMAELRRWWLPETACYLLGFMFSLFWLYEETHNSYNYLARDRRTGDPATNSRRVVARNYRDSDFQFLVAAVELEDRTLVLVSLQGVATATPAHRVPS